MATALLKEFNTSGLAGESGTFLLATNTCEVPTKLRQVVCAIVNYAEAPAAGSQLCCDGAITSGCVTVADAAVAAKGGFYTFLGYR